MENDNIDRFKFFTLAYLLEQVIDSKQNMIFLWSLANSSLPLRTVLICIYYQKRFYFYFFIYHNHAICFQAIFNVNDIITQISAFLKISASLKQTTSSDFICSELMPNLEILFMLYILCPTCQQSLLISLSMRPQMFDRTRMVRIIIAVIVSNH